MNFGSKQKASMNKSFHTYLKEHHPKTTEEGWGTKIIAPFLMAGALGAGGCTGPSCPATPPQLSSPTQQIEPFKDYVNRTQNMSSQERARQWQKRMGQKSAARQKGTPKELKGEKWTSPDAARFLQ